MSWDSGGGEAAAYVVNKARDAFEGSRNWESYFESFFSCWRRLGDGVDSANINLCLRHI